MVDGTSRFVRCRVWCPILPLFSALFFGLKLQRADCHSFASQTKAATLSGFICKLSSCLQIKKRVEIASTMLKLNKTSGKCLGSKGSKLNHLPSTGAEGNSSAGVAVEQGSSNNQITSTSIASSGKGGGNDLIGNNRTATAICGSTMGLVPRIKPVSTDGEYSRRPACIEVIPDSPKHWSEGTAPHPTQASANK